MGEKAVDARVLEIEALFTRMKNGDDGARSELQRRHPELIALADGGDADAQALAGGLFLEALRQPDEARRYFELAAAQGHRESRRGLGLMLLSAGDARQAGRAVELLDGAARDGDTFAAYNLGVLFRQGKLVAADEQRAMAMFRQSAELGLAAGAAAVAKGLTAQGEHAEARAWNLKAAELGNAPGMYALARAFRDGVGGEVDRVGAVIWFLRMLQVGDKGGVEEAMQVCASLSDDQIIHATREAGRPGDAHYIMGRVRP